MEANKGDRDGTEQGGRKEVKGVMVAKRDTHSKSRQELANSGNNKLVVYRSTLLPRIKHNQNKFFQKKKNLFKILENYSVLESIRTKHPKKRKAQQCKLKVFHATFSPSALNLEPPRGL